MSGQEERGGGGRLKRGGKQVGDQGGKEGGWEGRNSWRERGWGRERSREKGGEWDGGREGGKEVVLTGSQLAPQSKQFLHPRIPAQSDPQKTARAARGRQQYAKSSWLPSRRACTAAEGTPSSPAQQGIGHTHTRQYPCRRDRKRWPSSPGSCGGSLG